MNKRYEFRSNNTEILLNNIDNYDVVSLGSENCFHQIPSFKKITDLLQSIDQDKEVKIVTPFVPEESLDNMKKLLTDLAALQRKLSVVVNDIGILYFIHREKIDCFTVGVGRFLERSYSLIPWNEKILSDEKEYVRESFLQTNCSDHYKMEMYRGFGVKFFELNPLEHMEKSVESLKQNGFVVDVHFGNKIVAMSRSCPVKRYYKDQDLNVCPEKCNRSIHAKFKKKWIMPYNTETFEDSYKTDPELEKVFPELIIRGNKYLVRSDEKSAIYNSENVDRIIIEDWCANYSVKEVL